MELLIRLMRVLWYVDSAGLVLLLWRLAYLEIHKRYPALFLFLAVDLIAAAAGLTFGTRSLTYYWTYFFTTNLLGSILLVWMCREMFAELYGCYTGLVGITRSTLKRSVLIGSVGVLAVAPPVGLLHWGNPQFDCWQFPFVELHRCLSFGVALFVAMMWRKLRSLPLVVPRNVKTYAWWVFFNATSCGLVETAVLAIHRRLATISFSIFVLVVSLAFYGSLGLLIERPSEIRQPERLPIDREEFAWLSDISGLFARVDDAQRRGRASAIKRLPIFAVLLIGSFQNAWRACARAGGIILHLAQKE
jgi:hypothetical protein